MTARNDVIDYEVKEGAAVDAGVTVPLLVVAVDEDEAVSGFAFHTNGTFEYVTIRKESESDAPAITTDAFVQMLSNLTPEQRAMLQQAQTQSANAGAPVGVAPAASAPESGTAASRPEVANPEPTPAPKSDTPLDPSTPEVPDADETNGVSQ